MKITCAIFDVDGTLLDTFNEVKEALNGMLVQFNYPPVTYDECKLFMGQGSRVLISKAVKQQHIDEHHLQEMIDVYFKIYHANEDRYTTVYPGMMDFLKTLKENGVLLLIYSNKPTPLMQPVLKKFFNGIFDYAIGLTDGMPQKPDPAPVLSILNKHHIHPQDCIFIGDSGIDMQAAKNIGAVGIGMTYGARSKEELLENGAAYLFDDARSLTNLLRQEQPQQ